MRKILSHMRRAVDDYKMILPGDRIAVGVSGGKDSLVALCALKALQKFYPNEFYMEALTLDMGAPGMDFSGVEKLCKDLDVPYTILKTDIYEVIFVTNKPNEYRISVKTETVTEPKNWQDATAHSVNGIMFYVLKLSENEYLAVGQQNGFEYQISAANIDNLLIILGGMKKAT